MIIAVPSKGRAGNTSTQNIIASAVWFVPAAEYEQYVGAGHDTVAVPNEVKGITKTRNWILDNVEDRWVVMIDDDVKNAGWVELMPHKRHQRRLKENDFLKCFVCAFEILEGLKWKVWGAKTESSLRSCYPCRPILFQTYITASCMGIINDGSYRFDEAFELKEDYEIGLRHIVEFGGVLGLRYWHWENKHWDKEGGCGAYRTSAIEEKCVRQLQEKYPGFVRRVRRGGSQYSIELNF